nr:hypothetical protein [Tanacetum cinerariifolium]
MAEIPTCYQSFKKMEELTREIIQEEKDNKEKDKIRTKPDKIKSKREAWKSPDSSLTKSRKHQKLLAFLLDGLHEDLNRVKQKPYFETKDSDDHLDNEFWSYHKASIDSIVVDVCHSEVVSQCHLLLMSQNMVAARIKDLYQALDIACCVGSDETLILAEAYDHQIYHYLDGGDSLYSTKDDECIIAYRLSRNKLNFAS